MNRQLLLDCLPYLVAIGGALLVARGLVAASGARLSLGRLRTLGRDEQGAVQTLSFVLTLPVFVLLMMFIVQLSQITIGQIVVEYAAQAAARSASVWVPANLGASERENQISYLSFVEYVEGADENASYNVYRVADEGAKYRKIHLAAAMACMPICPSRDYAISRTHPGNMALSAIESAYRLLAPESAGNSKVPARLANKLAYALENTEVEILVHHKDAEPPLGRAYLEPWQLDSIHYPPEYADNEIGWQDRIVVKLTHHFALLPGPGRMLARRADAPIGSEPEASYGGSAVDPVADKVRQNNRVYVYSLSASARIANEGQRSVLPYWQQAFGDPSGATSVPEDQPDYEPTPDPQADSETVPYDELPSDLQGDAPNVDGGPTSEPPPVEQIHIEPGTEPPVPGQSAAHLPGQARGGTA